MAFQLDASGPVALPRPHSEGSTQTYWSDLSPFAQGYVEALLESFRPDPYKGWAPTFPKRFGFSDLAPETLARIIADCEAFLAFGRKLNQKEASPVPTFNWGATFWDYRQRDRWREFPPLTVQLGDDGKVRFAA